MTYALGVSDEEHRRLEMQAKVLEPYTRTFLANAGVTAGKRVLDIGSGTGDVTLLAAELVGPSGYVLGVDIEGRMVEYGWKRARAAVVPNVRFEQASLVAGEISEQFDVVIGRLVAFFQSDPTDFIRRAAERARPGGVVGFIEPIWTLNRPWSEPSSPAWNSMMDQYLALLKAFGAHPDLGASLGDCFIEAGLRNPTVLPPAIVDADHQAWLPMLLLGWENICNQARSRDLPCPSAIETAVLADEVQQVVRQRKVLLNRPMVVGGFAYTN